MNIIITPEDVDYLRADELCQLEEILNIIDNRKGRKNKTIYQRISGG